MSEIYINVADQVIDITESPLVASGGVKENYVNFTFSEEWDGFTKSAVFYQDEDNVYYSVITNNRAVIPWEVMTKAGRVFIGVYGVKNDVVRTSQVRAYKVVKGAITTDLNPGEATPEIYAQFIEVMNDVGEMVTSAEDAVNAAVTAMNEARAITKKRFIQTFNISSSTASVTFAPTDYVYTAGDRFEVYINGLKLTDNEFSTSGATITFATAISGSAEVVEVVCYKDIADASQNVDATLSISGMAADAKVTGDKINDLKEDLGELSNLETEDKSSIVGAINEVAGGSGSGLTADIKQALLQIAQKVAYIDDDGQDYYDDLYDALYAVTAISLNTNSVTINTIGGTSQLTATTTPEGGSVSWSSSNTSVATVSSSGLVTSVAYGSATITATAGSVSATCSVTVAQATCTGISAVYTQSGTVYDTDSLDSLKTDLVVTASWDNGTTSTLADSAYTLSGTLAEGTSTITVSYSGQTDTFSVTVSVYDTSPIIDVTGKTLKSNGSIGNNANGCYTVGYDYELNIDAFKETNYYDSTNNYCTYTGALLKIVYNIPNSNSVGFSGFTAVLYKDSGDEYISGTTMTFDGTEKNAVDTRYVSGFFTLSDNIVRLRFTLPVADVENSYAYWALPASNVMPVGVSAGDIIFAGENTPYYGMHNISEATTS